GPPARTPAPSTARARSRSSERRRELAEFENGSQVQFALADLRGFLAWRGPRTALGTRPGVASGPDRVKPPPIGADLRACRDHGRARLGPCRSCWRSYNGRAS